MTVKSNCASGKGLLAAIECVVKRLAVLGSVVQKLNDWLFGAVPGRGRIIEDWPTGTSA